MEFVVSVTVCSVRHRNCCLGLISFIFDWIFVKLEEIKEKHKISCFPILARLDYSLPSNLPLGFSQY